MEAVSSVSDKGVDVGSPACGRENGLCPHVCHCHRPIDDERETVRLLGLRAVAVWRDVARLVRHFRWDEGRRFGRVPDCLVEAEDAARALYYALQRARTETPK